MKTVKIDDDVREVLLRCTMTATSVTLPPGQLDRALYSRVDKVLKAAGGAWNRKAGAHLFTVDPRQVLTPGAVLQTEIVNKRQELQQFPTPDHVADMLVELAEVSPHHKCFEPSCGEGQIVKALIRAGVAPHRISVAEIDALCIEKVRVHVGSVLCGDFLAGTFEPVNDRIVMNPPFSKGQDIAHVTHAMTALKRGGILVAVMAPSIEFRDTKAHKAFAELMGENDGHIQTTLPEATFEHTKIRTTVIRMVKAS